jgi:hypothetical protein
MVEVEPANRLPLPKLVTFPYRLYPVANQVADKLSATIADYRGRPSSREKDLVDLVVLALTQTVRADDLLNALVTECRLRKLAPPKRFAVPATWGGAYARLAATAGPAARYPDVGAATELMRRFVDPVLSGSASGAWDPAALDWNRR